MDGIRTLLEAARDNGVAAGLFRGLLHVAIGRTVTGPGGAVVSNGVTWRELAGWLKTRLEKLHGDARRALVA